MEKHILNKLENQQLLRNAIVKTREGDWILVLELASNINFLVRLDPEGLSEGNCFECMESFRFNELIEMLRDL